MDQCAIIGVKFLPINIYMDFEKAIHNAAQKVWPTIHVKSCHFHLQFLGLTTDYKNNIQMKATF